MEIQVNILQDASLTLLTVAPQWRPLVITHTHIVQHNKHEDHTSPA